MKKLIIIEDDTDARDMAVFTFENNGYEVVKATKEITVDEISRLQAHIVVVDYMLSGTPGNDICKKLKASNLTGNIPLILYSATEDIDTISKGSCADGFVAKPLELEDFVYLVHRIALS